MAKKPSISAQLEKLYEFCAHQVQHRPKILEFAPRLIDKPRFFTINKLQDYLNNPLLTPEWVNVILNGKFISLEEITFSRLSQQKEMRFMDKKMIDEYINQGAAVVLEGIEIMDEKINDFIGKVDELLPVASSDCVAFFSQQQQEAYGGHRDSDDVLVVQLAGEKHWKVFEPQQRRYFGNTPLTLEQMGNLHTEFTMKPGDAFYLRSGVPHIVHTPGKFSLHVAFDITDRTSNIDQITHEANNRYNHACADSFSSAADVVNKYIELLNSDQFQADLKSANEQMRQEAIKFRKRMGQSSCITSLSRFAN